MWIINFTIIHDGRSFLPPAPFLCDFAHIVPRPFLCCSSHMLHISFSINLSPFHALTTLPFLVNPIATPTLITTAPTLSCHHPPTFDKAAPARQPSMRRGPCGCGIIPPRCMGPSTSHRWHQIRIGERWDKKIFEFVCLIFLPPPRMEIPSTLSLCVRRDPSRLKTKPFPRRRSAGRSPPSGGWPSSTPSPRSCF